jgi:hypothetical protein
MLVCRICLQLTIVLSVRDVTICQMHSRALPCRRTLLHRHPGMSHRSLRTVFYIPCRDIVRFCWGSYSSRMADVFRQFRTLGVGSDNGCSLLTFNSDDCKIEA